MKKKEAFRLLSEELSLKENVLFSLPVPWCLWETNTSKIECSEAFKDILLLKDHSFITIEQVFHQLEAKDFSPLAKAMQHLLEFGGAFQIQVSPKNLKKEILISGKIVAHSSSVKKSEELLVLISCEDLTHKYAHEEQTREKINCLKLENEMLNFIFDEIPLAIWYRNKQGLISQCNQMYALALNLTKEKILAENIEFFNSEHVNLFNLSKKALAENDKQIARLHTVIDGNRRFLEIAEMPLQSKKMTVGYAMDITEVNLLEVALKETSKGYMDILNALSIPIAVFDESQRLSFYNLAYQQLFEFEKRLLDLCPTLSDLLDDLRARRKIQEYADFKMHKKEREMLFYNLITPVEEVSYLPDGRTLRIRISPYPLGGILFIYENITSQLGLERNVNTLLAVQKTTLDHLDEGILVVGNDGKLRLVNPAVYKIWTIEDPQNKEDMFFKDWMKLIKERFSVDEDYQSWQQHLLQKFSKRLSFKDRIYLENQQVIEWLYVPLPDGSHMIGFIDVSDEWLHEQNLKSRNLNLELTQKLKRDYAQEMSVELTPPVDDILGFSNTLRQEVFGELNEKQLDYCQMIHAHAYRLKTLLNDVLESIQLDHDHIMINFEKISLESFFQKLELLIVKKCNDAAIEINIDIDIAVQHTTIDGDENRLSKAFFGLISYFVRNTSRGDEISMNIYVDEDDLYVIFKSPLQDGRKITTSLNLGKTMAHIIIERHGGKVLEESDAHHQWINCKIPLKK
jgi:PAS domain-containing protein